MKAYLFIISLLMSIVLFGCSSEEPLPPAQNLTNVQSLEQTNSSIFATEAEVNAVINKFVGEPESRANSIKRDIALIYGKKNIPAYYIVNVGADKGFFLVSAVKDYMPILAYSFSGSFSTEAYTRPGIAEWLIDITNAIDNATEAPDSIKNEAHNMWATFTGGKEYPQGETTTSGRSSDIGDRNNHPELLPIMEDSIKSWVSKGWEVYNFEDYNFTNPSRYEMIQYMQGAADWRYIEDAAALTLIVKKSEVWTNGSPSNLNGIRWDQNEPWNYAYPLVNDGTHAVAGCVPVAVGQFMYYKKYPSSFNWSGMHPTYATSDSQSFLYLLAEKMKANYNKNDTGTKRHTSVSTSNMISTLKSYGYKVSESSKIGDAGFPCIVTSEMKDINGKTGGHAYILCGSSTTITTERIDCWTFTKPNSLNPCYELYNNSSSIKFYYINWGWGGYCDGVYAYPENRVPNSNYVSNKITKYITPRN